MILKKQTYKVKRFAFFLIVLSLLSTQKSSAQNPNFDNVQIHTLHVQGNVYMLVGGGGNVTVQIGDDGVLMVDTSFPQLTDMVLAEIQKLSDKPVRLIINTHMHPDHTGGNEKIAQSGTSLRSGFA